MEKYNFSDADFKTIENYYKLFWDFSNWAEKNNRVKEYFEQNPPTLRSYLSYSWEVDFIRPEVVVFIAYNYGEESRIEIPIEFFMGPKEK